MGLALSGMLLLMLGACSAQLTATPQPTFTPTIAAFTQETRYVIDTEQSIVRYNATGNGAFGALQFPGTFKLKSGTVVFAAESGGTRVKIDLTIDGDSVTAVNGLVLSSLRNSLEIEKYPFGFFVADSEGWVDVSRSAFDLLASGSLELRGRRRSIAMPARITLEGDALRAEGELTIDLADYEVNVPTAIMNSRLAFSALIVGRRDGSIGER